MIFHIKNIYVYISWYFVAMILWAIITGKAEAFLICFFSLILHELGHIIMVKSLKEKINIFYILPFGFCCKLKNQNKVSDKNMIKILLAGPATSFIVAGFFIFWTKELFISNLVIGVFNLIPFGNLDGGRLFKIITNTA